MGWIMLWLVSSYLTNYIVMRELDFPGANEEETGLYGASLVFSPIVVPMYWVAFGLLGICVVLGLLIVHTPYVRTPFILIGKALEKR